MLWGLRSGDFKEVIRRGAITQEMVNSSDVFATLDHNRGRGILARSRNGQGSLQLEVDEKGLKYRFTIPDTQIGLELRAYLERGEITASSFAFSISKEDWIKGADGIYTRSVNEIDGIYDVSAVFNPAYVQTEVAMRSFEQIEKREIEVATVKDNREKAVRNAKMMRLRLNMR
jgi:HK97 family phage prohead protease